MALLVEKKENKSPRRMAAKRRLFPMEVISDEEKFHELSNYPDIASRLAVIRRLHLKCVHYEALSYIKRLETFIKLKYDDSKKEMLNLLNEHPRIIKIKSEIQKGDETFHLMTSNDGEWKLIKDDGQCSTEYKEDSPTQSFRLKGIGNVKMINILTIFYEVDLISTWLPLAKQAHEVCQLSLFSKVGYMRMGAPWPIQDRECVIFTFGIDDLKNNDKLLIIFDSNKKSHEQMLEKFGIKLPPITKDKVRIDVTLGGFLLEKVQSDKNKTKMTVVWNVDPKIYVPQLLLKWFTGKFAAKIISSIVEQARSVDTDREYIRRMRKNGEFYGAIKQKLSSKK